MPFAEYAFSLLACLRAEIAISYGYHSLRIYARTLSGQIAGYLNEVVGFSDGEDRDLQSVMGDFYFWLVGQWVRLRSATDLATDYSKEV